jgi:hypothetical protein
MSISSEAETPRMLITDSTAASPYMKILREIVIFPPFQVWIKGGTTCRLMVF